MPNGWAPSRTTEFSGTSGSGNSVYSHLICRLPCVSVFRSNEDSAPEPTAPLTQEPFTDEHCQPGPLLLSVKPVWPQ